MDALQDRERREGGAKDEREELQVEECLDVLLGSALVLPLTQFDLLAFRAFDCLLLSWCLEKALPLLPLLSLLFLNAYAYT